MHFDVGFDLGLNLYVDSDGFFITDVRFDSAGDLYSAVDSDFDFDGDFDMDSAYSRKEFSFN